MSESDIQTTKEEVAADALTATCPADGITGEDAAPIAAMPEESNAKVYKIGKLHFTKDNARHFTRYALLLVALACIRSFTTYVFTIPNGFAPGGLGGISSIIYNVVILVNPDDTVLRTVFDPGLTMFIMNIPFIIISFFVLNKKFAINTFFIVSIYSGLMFLLGAVDCPQYAVKGDPGHQLLAAFAGGACAGFCLGMMLRNNMSMGGTDIIGKIIHKHNPAAGAQWWILICDCVVATCSGVLGILNIKGLEASEALVAVLSPIFFSFISLIVGSLTADAIQAGFQSSIVFNIITDKPEEISQAIGSKLHRGVTISTAVGAYTGAEHKMLTCVVSKRQISLVKQIIHDTDPLSFTYITKAHEVAGKGFHSAG